MFVLIPPCLNYHVFLFSFEAGEKTGFWFCSFAILGPVYFYVTFRISLLTFAKRQMGFFDSDCMELADQIWWWYQELLLKKVIKNLLTLSHCFITPPNHHPYGSFIICLKKGA